MTKRTIKVVISEMGADEANRATREFKVSGDTRDELLEAGVIEFVRAVDDVHSSTHHRPVETASDKGEPIGITSLDQQRQARSGRPFDPLEDTRRGIERDAAKAGRRIPRF